MSITGKKASKKLDFPTAGIEDKVTLAGLFLLAFLFLTVFVPLSSAEDAGVGRTILVGTYENSPKIYTDEQGNTVGLFPDILAYIADSEGWEIQYVHGTWTENLERLEKNEIDIMPDVAYSDERAEIYEINNESVLINWGILYTKKDSDIQSIPDLQGKRVAVMNGSIHTVGEAGIIKLVEQFDVDCTFIGVDDYTEVFGLLDTGEADAGVVNRLFGALHEHEFDVEKTNVVFEPVDLKFAFPKNSTISGLLIERIDYHLLAMKKDPGSLYYQTLEKYLFVPEETRIPDWVVPAFLGLLGLIVLFLIMGAVLKWQVNARTAELRAANEELEHDIIERKKAEEELQESEEKFRRVIESSPDAITVTDLNGTIVDCNQETLNLHGFSTEEELIGKIALDLIAPKDQQKALEKLEKTLKQKILKNEEYTFLKKDGKEFQAELSASLILDSYGKPKGFVAITRDITERKRAEETLRESEEKYRHFFETSSDAVFITTKEGRWVDFNDAAVTLFGYDTAEELRAMRIADLYENPAKRKQHIQLIEEQGFTKNYPVNLRKKDGSIMNVHITSVVRRDEAGKVVGFQGTIRDVTEQERAEAALLEALKKREELEEIINNSPAIVFLWRAAEGWPVEFVSDNVRQWGYTPADFYSGDVPYASIVYPPDLERVVSEVDQYSEEGRTEFTQEYRIITKTGEIRWLDDRTWIRRDARGVITHYQGIALDITERKRVEAELERYLVELEQRAAELERFVYTISHELRTPLVTVQGFAGMLRKDLEQNKGEHVETDVQVIEDTVATMGALLQDTLELSRTGRVMNPQEDVPFGVLVRDALAHLADQIKLSGVEMSVAPDLPTVHVDRLRLVEVLVNLIENGIKFMGDQPPPKIEVGYRVEDGEPVFFVKDNGIGLDTSQHEKVFELFYKQDKKSKGTGAGLAIVKRIIEAHQGRIWIESQKGEGCTVCFTLPLR